jgi:hypothetical protein
VNLRGQDEWPGRSEALLAGDALPPVLG